jgi:hypothetical protein
LLHFFVIAALTAASSRRMPSANRRRSGSEEASPRASHSPKVSRDRFRINSANPSARSNAAANSSLRPRMASSRTCSAGFRFSARRAHSKESCLADGRAGTGGSAALSRSRRFPAAPSRFVTNS